MVSVISLVQGVIAGGTRSTGPSGEARTESETISHGAVGCGGGLRIK